MPIIKFIGISEQEANEYRSFLGEECHELTPETHGDGITRLMEEAGIELTLENYLSVAFLGEVPEELDGEVLEEMPEWFRVQYEAEQRKKAR